MTIGIVGSRRRDTLEDYLLVEGWFKRVYTPGDKIVSGGCPKGADRFAEIIAITLAAPPGNLRDVNYLFTTTPLERQKLIEQLKAPILIHRPDWATYGKYAGIHRNTLVAKDALDVLIACVAPDRTGGTEDTIRKFRKEHPSGKVVLC